MECFGKIQKAIKRSRRLVGNVGITKQECSFWYVRSQKKGHGQEFFS